MSWIDHLRTHISDLTLTEEERLEKYNIKVEVLEESGSHYEYRITSPNCRTLERRARLTVFKNDILSFISEEQKHQ